MRSFSVVRFVQLHDLLSIVNNNDYCCSYFGGQAEGQGGQVLNMTPVKRSSTEYDAGQAVKALFEWSNTLTTVAVVSTGPIGVTPPFRSCRRDSWAPPN